MEGNNQSINPVVVTRKIDWPVVRDAKGGRGGKGSWERGGGRDEVGIAA